MLSRGKYVSLDNLHDTCEGSQGAGGSVVMGQMVKIKVFHVDTSWALHQYDTKSVKNLGGTIGR